MDAKSNVSILVPPPYLTFVLCAENAAISVLKLGAIGLMAGLMLLVHFVPHRVRVNRLSDSMYLYFGAHIAGALLSLPFVVNQLQFMLATYLGKFVNSKTANSVKRERAGHPWYILYI